MYLNKNIDNCINNVYRILLDNVDLHKCCERYVIIKFSDLLRRVLLPNVPEINRKKNKKYF